MKTKTLIIGLVIALITSCASPLSSRLNDYVNKVESNCQNWTEDDWDRSQSEYEKLLEEYKQQLAEAKAQASQIIADAKKAGESVKADIEGKAQVEAANMIEKAKVAIEAEKKQAVHELQSSVADLTVSVTARIVGEDLSDDEHRAIIERYVNEAGSFNAE